MRPARLGVCLLVIFALTSIPAFAEPAPDSSPTSVTAAAAPDLPGAALWVPWADFKKILDRLTAAGPTPPEDPPVDAVISAADYQAIVGDNGVSVTVTAAVNVLKEKGWARLAVLGTGLPLADATLDGKPTALLDGNDGTLHLAVRGLGAHALKLRLELPLGKDDGPTQFTLPALRAPVHRLTVRVDRPDLEIRLSPSGHVQSKTVGATTIATGAFPPTSSVVVSWTRRAPKSAKAEARVAAEVRTMLTVGEGLGVYTAIIDYDIQHKPLSRLGLLLPAGVAVADVSTEGLADWRVSPVDDGQELRIELAFEAIGRHQVAVTYEQTLPTEATLTVPVADIAPTGVVHEVGYLAVAVRTNVAVTPHEGSLKNLAPLDVTELPADLRGSGDQKVLFGFKYLKHPFGLDLDVVKHKDATVLTCKVESANYRIMLTDDGKELIEGTFRIANRSRQYLALTLPPGSDLWGAFRDGQPIKAAESDGRILLPIFQNRPGDTMTLRVLAYRNNGALWPFGRRGLDLPTLDVGAGKVFVEMFLPTRYRFFGFGGDLRPTQAGAPTSVTTSDQPDDPMAGKGGEMSEGLDLDLLDENRRYRNEQSKIQWQAANLPVQAANMNYAGALARGALPVAIQVQWDGQSHRLGKTIVDPDEKLNVRFSYALRSRSEWVGLLVALLAGLIGYLAAAYLVARKTADVPLPSRRWRLIGLVAVVVVALLSLLRGTPTPVLVLCALVGAAAVPVFWLLKRRRDRRAKIEGGAS